MTVTGDQPQMPAEDVERVAAAAERSGGTLVSTWNPPLTPRHCPVAAGRHANRVVAEVGYEVKASAECFDVPRDDVERGDLAVFDLGYAGDAHAHPGGHILLRHGALLARLGELVTAGFGQQTSSTGFDFGGIDTGCVELLFEALPVLRGLSRHRHSSVSRV